VVGANQLAVGRPDYPGVHDQAKVKILNGPTASIVTNCGWVRERPGGCSRTTLGARFDYRLNQDVTSGPRCCTCAKTGRQTNLNIGDGPGSNTIYGFDVTCAATRALTKPPGYAAVHFREPSSVAFDNGCAAAAG
jgi:hypothetical protein